METDAERMIYSTENGREIQCGENGREFQCREESEGKSVPKKSATGEKGREIMEGESHRHKETKDKTQRRKGGEIGSPARWTEQYLQRKRKECQRN